MPLQDILSILLGAASNQAGQQLGRAGQQIGQVAANQRPSTLQLLLGVANDPRLSSSLDQSLNPRTPDPATLQALNAPMAGAPQLVGSAAPAASAAPPMAPADLMAGASQLAGSPTTQQVQAQAVPSTAATAAAAPAPAASQAAQPIDPGMQMPDQPGSVANQPTGVGGASPGAATPTTDANGVILEEEWRSNPGLALASVLGINNVQDNFLLGKAVNRYDDALPAVMELISAVTGQENLSARDVGRQLAMGGLGRGAQVDVGGMLRTLLGRASTGDETALDTIAGLGTDTLLDLIGLSEQERGVLPGMRRARARRREREIMRTRERELQTGESSIADWAKLLNDLAR